MLKTLSTQNTLVQIAQLDVLLGLEGGWNRFVYVRGNPILYVDPYGQFIALPAVCMVNPAACYMAGAAAATAAVYAIGWYYSHLPSIGDGVIHLPTLHVNASDTPDKGTEESCKDIVLGGSPSPNDDDRNRQDNGEKKPDNMKKVNDNYLKKNDIDAHKLKNDFLGKGSNSRYDLYVDKKTGEIWIFNKGGKGAGIPTGEFIK